MNKSQVLNTLQKVSKMHYELLKKLAEVSETEETFESEEASDKGEVAKSIAELIEHLSTKIESGELNDHLKVNAEKEIARLWEEAKREGVFEMVNNMITDAVTSKMEKSHKHHEVEEMLQSGKHHKKHMMN